jgi:predicted nucleotidyltransferase
MASSTAQTAKTRAAASPAGKKIDAMVRRIVQRFDPEKVILFGSHARGTAGPDSDVDLLVVMTVRGSKRDT